MNLDGDRQIEESTDITLLLRQISSGESQASDELFAAVYRQLRQIAGAQMGRLAPGHTLSPTALVNEAYVKMVDRMPVTLENRVHFFRVAARAMRQVLIDHAEKKNATKRGGELQKITLDDSLMAQIESAEQLLQLNDALQRFERVDPRAAQIVEYRFFAGLDVKEVGELLEISESTVKREWRAARAWLREALESGESSE